jgi:uroporphyrinogen-III synthase
VVNLFVYKTVELEVESLPIADVVVFTSPSNVRGYLSSTKWNSEIQKAVAIGDSTAFELKNHGISSTVSFNYSELALADTVLNLTTLR